jgi:hypothetical protein
VEDVTMGHVRNAISQPLRIRAAAFKGGLKRYKDDRLNPLQPLARHIEPALKRAFDVIVKGTIAAIEDLLASAARPSQAKSQSRAHRRRWDEVRHSRVAVRTPSTSERY